MTHRAKVLIMAAHGPTVIASSLIRYFTQERGEKGLWFGLVMGSIGVASGLALGKRHTRTGLAGGMVTTLLVGGWFGYEALALKGLAQAELRMFVVLVASFAAALALLVPTRGLPDSGAPSAS